MSNVTLRRECPNTRRYHKNDLINKKVLKVYLLPADLEHFHLVPQIHRQWRIKHPKSKARVTKIARLASLI